MPTWICEEKNYRAEYNQGEPEWKCKEIVEAKTKREASKKVFGHIYCSGVERIRKMK